MNNFKKICDSNGILDSFLDLTYCESEDFLKIQKWINKKLLEKSMIVTASSKKISLNLSKILEKN